MTATTEGPRSQQVPLTVAQDLLQDWHVMCDWRISLWTGNQMNTINSVREMDGIASWKIAALN